nr:hypothetical protein [uncultured Celeribacter sp.]
MSTCIFPELSSVRIPEGCALRRDYPLPEPRRNDAYIRAFDSRTLIYDALSLSERRVRLICPRLLNLRSALREGLQVDGVAARIHRHHRSLRFEVIDLECSPQSELSVALPDVRLSVPVHEKTDIFVHQNVAMTMIKNTPCDWIVDWARYHVSAHGLQGLLLFDNGSENCDLPHLADRLSREAGLSSIALVSAPLPYGGNAGGRFVAPAKYLQVSLMQIARWRFFARSRAVLSVDIDEMVTPITGSTVFDAAMEARFGLGLLQGTWVYPPQAKLGQLQKHHTLWRPKEETPCPSKWCLARGGLADRFAWAVHRPGGPLHSFAQTIGQFWHCYATTTGWKRSRPNGVADTEIHTDAIEAMSTHL